MKRKLIYILAFISLVISFSCKKYLTVEPSGYIPGEQTFKTADDAISAVYGLYGLMQPLVDQMFLAGEAQADLVVSARGADASIAEIAQNRVTPQNPYTDYSKFYKLIVACNNTLVGLDKLTRVDPVNYTVERYNYNVAEVIYIRSWTYLQMVKIWGDVPIIDQSITSVDQITNVAPSKAEVVLAKIQDEAAKYYPIMLTANPVSNPAAGQNFAGTEIRNFRAQFNSFAAICLMTELYLYNNNYDKAKEAISQLLPYGTAGIFNVGDSFFDYGLWSNSFGAYTGGDANNGRALFIDFDGSKGQTNNLQRWTSNVIQNDGVYALKPSANAIQNWKQTPNMLLLYQNTASGYYTDFTKAGSGNTNPVLDGDGNPVVGSIGDVVRGEGVSYLPSGKDTLIFKYLIKTRGVIRNQQQNDNNSKNDAMYFVYRDGPMYLLACEIFNHAGLSNQVVQMLNGGAGGGGLGAFKSTRYRARVVPFKLDPNGGDVVKQVDKMILQEKALEGAFEGMRWFDLVRMAKNSGDASILANAVAKKYPASQQAAIIARLSNPNYWYFPYYQRNVETNSLLKQKAGY
jgi:hypothetical protein